MSRPVRPWTPQLRPLVLVAEVLIVLLLIWLARPLWSVLLLAMVLAYVVNMPVQWVTSRLRVPRVVVIIVIYLLILLIIVGLPLLAIPFVVDQTQQMLSGLPGFVANVQQVLARWIESPPTVELFGLRYDPLPLIQSLQGYLVPIVTFEVPPPQELTRAVEQLLRSAAGVLGVATGLATNLVGRFMALAASLLITLVLSFYLLAEGDAWRQRLVALVPPAERDDVLDLIDQTAHLWRAYFRGQLILSTVVGVMTFILLTAIGLPGAALLAIVAGILEVLPNIGPVLAMIPAAIVALIQGSTWLPLPNWQVMLLVLLIYVLVQQVENNLLVPRIHSQSVDLPPVIVMVAVLVGALKGGILGALLAAPLMGTLRVWLSYLHRRLIAGAGPSEELPGPPVGELLSLGQEGGVPSPPSPGEGTAEDVPETSRPV